MLAAANVELVLYEGCLRMGSADVHLIIWPPGFSLASEDDGVQILNETGLIVARVGEKVRMSGGQVRSLRHTGDYVPRHLPPQLPGTLLDCRISFHRPASRHPHKLSSE